MRASSSWRRLRSAGSVVSANRSVSSKKRSCWACLVCRPVSIRSTRTRLAVVWRVSARARTRLAMRDGSETLCRTDGFEAIWVAGWSRRATRLFCGKSAGLERLVEDGMSKSNVARAYRRGGRMSGIGGDSNGRDARNWKLVAANLDRFKPVKTAARKSPAGCWRYQDPVRAMRQSAHAGRKTKLRYFTDPGKLWRSGAAPVHDR